ncbi:CbiX/SirB N-terminal domain-containing protein [Leptospira licerasiae]|uniref:Sirohydrochlorin cobaltochelatase n=1 Tax=Leptospira licerasiae str. MMD4847 TaxID=1049971 RepID=A0ABP2RFP9_9LEPT|nr:CbiX/SirB N-terminal domain-containing protein [Leptospira licerasiae]EIE00420.1 sirohydrochlorin cobaltochelatase [Leptospira licerasiae serovar Varillal str. VAR 010]EJZ43290.1 sirohydrochlorin cobaltochelatase [Leptospira licerasiae str. MMD4847]
MKPKIAVLVLGHGSREENSNLEFVSLVEAYSISRPDLKISYAYVELAKPDLETALRDLSKEYLNIIIFPLFLYSSGHIKNDIPIVLDRVKSEFPGHSFKIANSLGIHSKMISLLRKRTEEFLPLNKEQSHKTGVIVVNRGSSDPDANGDFYKTVRLFQEGNYFSFVLPCFIGIANPLLSDTLEMASKLRPEKLLVVPYFLFGGKLIQKISALVQNFSEKFPWIKTELSPYLGPDPELLSVIDERIQDSISGKSSLPCDNCEYRTQLPGLSKKVGGLKALLWSIRHLETHNQAAPHQFPHRNLQKHIFVCDNIDCADKGSSALVARMRSILKVRGRHLDFKISRSSCMGRCGEGPVVVVYPDGVWYQKVNVEDAEDLVSEHLLQDKLVSRLIDNIMQ